MLAAERGISIILALASVAIGLVQLAEPILFGRVVDTLSRGEAAFPYIALWALLGLFGILAGAAVAVFADRLSHRRSPRRGLVGSSFIPSPHWMVARRRGLSPCGPPGYWGAHCIASWCMLKGCA